MSIEKLIADIQSKCYDAPTISMAMDKTAELIRKHTENMVLVPREPTDEMINNGCIALAGSIGGYEAGCVDKCYNAMLSIAEAAE